MALERAGRDAAHPAVQGTLWQLELRSRSGAGSRCQHGAPDSASALASVDFGTFQRLAHSLPASAAAAAAATAAAALTALAALAALAALLAVFVVRALVGVSE